MKRYTISYLYSLLLHWKPCSCKQVFKVRIHARNYIAPFVDSITASLATRFIMGIIERSQVDRSQVEAETYSLSTSRRTSVDSSFTITSFQSPHPITFRTTPQETDNETNAVNDTASALPPSRASLDLHLSDNPSLPPSIMTSPASWQVSADLSIHSTPHQGGYLLLSRRPMQSMS
ncbi:hypothetical protein C8R46DRAFT_372740 [Mycena filopes]|nr:hypothetical protein C8R46DRAFT_372740 [Mycena filopes]